MTDTDPGSPGNNVETKFQNTAGVDNITGDKTHIGYFATLIHLVKGYLGTGLFAMGEAHKNSGLVLGPIMLTFLAGLNLHCQHQLVNCAERLAEQEEVDVRPNYSETVKFTLKNSWFGQHSHNLGLMADIFLIFAEVGFACVYYLFVARHLMQVVGVYGWDLNIHVMLAVILLPMWVSTFLGNLKLLTPLSLISNILMAVGVVIIYYFTCQDLVPISERELIRVAPDKYALFFGTTLFAFEGICFILPLRAEMKNTKEFSSPLGILNVGIFITLLLYASVGVMTYWKYGDEVKGSVVLNLPPSEILSQVIKIIMCIAMIFTYAWHVYVLFVISYPFFYKRFGPFKHPKCIMIAFKTIAVFLTYVMANAIPKLELIISFVGSLTGATLGLIIPPILEMVAFRGEQSKICLVKNILIITIGVVGMLCGIGVSLYDIVTSFEEHTMD